MPPGLRVDEGERRAEPVPEERDVREQPGQGEERRYECLYGDPGAVMFLARQFQVAQCEPDHQGDTYRSGCSRGRAAQSAQPRSPGLQEDERSQRDREEERIAVD